MQETGRVIKHAEAFNDVVTALMNGETIDEFECDGYRLSQNKKLVSTIIEGLEKKNRFCPCRVFTIQANICCCTDFIENGHCCCGIWEKIEEEQENA